MVAFVFVRLPSPRRMKLTAALDCPRARTCRPPGSKRRRPRRKDSEMYPCMHQHRLSRLGKHSCTREETFNGFRRKRGEAAPPCCAEARTSGAAPLCLFRLVKEKKRDKKKQKRAADAAAGWLQLAATSLSGFRSNGSTERLTARPHLGEARSDLQIPCIVCACNYWPPEKREKQRDARKNWKEWLGSAVDLAWIQVPVITCFYDLNNNSDGRTLPPFFFVVVVVYASETVLSELRTGHNSRNGDSSIAGAFFFFLQG